MKNTLSKIISLFALLVCLNGFCQTANNNSSDQISAEELKVLVGEWKGSLTYIDYISNKPYKMPADLIVKKSKNPNLFLISYIYPNEPNANSKDKIRVSKNGRKLNKKPVMSKQQLSDDQLEIITSYLGKDNKRKALIRSVYLLSNESFVIKKEVKYLDSDDWLKRNEYNFSR